jgi:uncharacterized protein
MMGNIRGQVGVGHRRHDVGAERDDNQADDELSGDAVGAEPLVIAPEKRAHSPNGVYEFRGERWVEFYTKKIEEMIGVLRSKGVPVLWVGLPVVRGPKATSDTLFLDALYRSAADKAGIDVWDGFVDEAGRFMQRGPDLARSARPLRRRPISLSAPEPAQSAAALRFPVTRWWRLLAPPPPHRPRPGSLSQADPDISPTHPLPSLRGGRSFSRSRQACRGHAND